MWTVQTEEPVFSTRTVSTFSAVFCFFPLCSFNKYLCKQRRRLPKAASLPPPSLSAECVLLEVLVRIFQKVHDGKIISEKSGCKSCSVRPSVFAAKKKKKSTSLDVRGCQMIDF